MRLLFQTLLLIIVPGTLAAQPKAPTFEAADVHASAPGASQSGAFLPNGRVEYRGTSLLHLISAAYSLPVDRIAGGPPWLDTELFDVTAQAAGNASQSALRTMLKDLLAERFDLAVESEDKPIPVFALVPSKRGAPKPTANPVDPDCQTGTEENVRVYNCHSVTMQSLAERLPLLAPGYFNKPVVDRTGYTGAFDFTLRFLGRGQVPGGSETNPLHLFAAIEKQLGASVEAQTAPLPVLSINKANRTPKPNPPGVTEKLGPPPTEFDVAEIRRSKPDSEQDADIKNGRLAATGLSLRDLISFAYNVEEDWVKGGEKWVETDRFDIVAKTAPTESEDTLRVMLRSLLADRFKLKIHKEEQSVAVFALTAGKPKLKEAGPAERSTCKGGLADGMRTLECTNTSMAQLAEKIRPVAGPYLDHKVVDLTGLPGAYNFSLSWTPWQRLFGPSAKTAEGADRPAGLTLFEAIDRQIGLKLTPKKHPMSVVVIDHVDRNPTAN